MKNIVFLEEFTPDTDYDKKVHIEIAREKK